MLVTHDYPFLHVFTYDYTCVPMIASDVLVTPSDKTIRATKATDSIVLQSMMAFLFLYSVQVEYMLKTELYCFETSHNSCNSSYE